jgi:tetratricopeptide (TPR) repeat protein
MLQWLATRTFRWDLVNIAIDVFVTAGLYSEALRVQQGRSTEDLARAHAKDHYSFALATINQAEAMHNLGRSDDALALLESVREESKQFDFTRSGWACLQAWILIHLGRLGDARLVLGEYDLSGIRAYYAAEISYTQAALERESGNLELALEHAHRGLVDAARASSVRNGLFMVADIAARLGNMALAHTKFREAVDHPYEAQSADGLIRWARQLALHGEGDEARRIVQLAARRDPESGLVRSREPFELANSGLQQTPPSRSLGRRS